MAMRQNSLRILLHKFALISLLLVLVCSCQDKKLQARFDTVERIVSDYPDSAMQLLNEVKERKFSTSEQARYDLLTAEARYMSGENDTIPGRLTEIAEYYDRKGDSHNAARAYYYEGIIYQNVQEYAKGIISLLKSEKRTQKNKEDIPLGLVYRALGDCYAYLDDYLSSLRYYTLANSEFNKVPNKYGGYALIDISNAYYMTGNDVQSMNYALSAYKYGESHNDTSLQCEAIRIIADINYDNKKWAETIQNYSTLNSLRSSELRDREISKLGVAHLYLGHLKIAQNCLDSLKSFQENENLPILECNIAYSKKDYHKAFILLEELVNKQNNEVQENWRRNYNIILSDYYKQEEKIAEDKISHERMEKCLTIAILICIIILAIILSYRIYKKIKEAKILNNKYIENLNAELCNLQSKLIEINDCSEDRLLLSHISSLHTISISIANINDNLKVREALLKYATEVTTSLIDSNNLKRLENYVDQKQDGLLTNFRHDIDNASEKDCQLFLFYAIGISPLLISMIWECNVDAIYNRKSRLIKKIYNHAPSKADIYISVLSHKSYI
jgi:tetratricopeptide (TPR) repeat protein